MTLVMLSYPACKEVLPGSLQVQQDFSERWFRGSSSRVALNTDQPEDDVCGSSSVAVGLGQADR